jgi:hypothetical protein
VYVRVSCVRAIRYRFSGIRKPHTRPHI